MNLCQFATKIRYSFDQLLYLITSCLQSNEVLLSDLSTALRELFYSPIELGNLLMQSFRAFWKGMNT